MINLLQVNCIVTQYCQQLPISVYWHSMPHPQSLRETDNKCYQDFPQELRQRKNLLIQPAQMLGSAFFKLFLDRFAGYALSLCQAFLVVILYFTARARFEFGHRQVDTGRQLRQKKREKVRAREHESAATDVRRQEQHFFVTMQISIVCGQS